MASKTMLTDRMKRSKASSTPDRFEKADAALDNPSFQANIAPNAAMPVAIEADPAPDLPTKSDLENEGISEVTDTTRLSFTMTMLEKETIDRIRIDLFEAGGRKAFPSEGEVIRVALQLLEEASSQRVVDAHAKMPKLVRGKGVRG